MESNIRSAWGCWRYKSQNNVGENVVQIILVDFMSFSDLDY